ncbi:MAG: hypothetical protein ACM3ZE_06470 [Myxococcales bacterium]
MGWRSGNRRLACLSFGCWLIGFPAAAVAAPTAADRETARDLMDQGDDQMDQRQYAEALRLYRAADDLMHVPTTAIEVAHAQAALGLLVEARTAALAVLRFPQLADEPEAFAEARASAQKLADELDARIPILILELLGASDLRKAVVRVDGTDIPPSALGLPRRLNPGSHTITVMVPGHDLITRKITLAEKASAKLGIDLDVEVRSPAGDSRRVDMRHTNHVKSPDQQGAPGSVRLPIATYVGFGLGGLGLGVGALAGYVSWSQTADIRREYCQQRPCTPEGDEAIHQANVWANVSNVALGVGVVGIVIGAMSWLTAPPRTKPARASVTAVQSNFAGEYRSEARHGPASHSLLGIEGHF